MPYIPAFRIVMQDIQYLKEIEIITLSGLFNFKRSIQIYNYIEDVFKCKYIPYNLPTFSSSSQDDDANISNYDPNLFEKCTRNPNESHETPIKSTESDLDSNLFIRCMWKGVGEDLMNAILKIAQNSRDIIKTTSSRMQSRN
jgi:hypothetical protein